MLRRGVASTSRVASACALAALACRPIGSGESPPRPAAPSRTVGAALARRDYRWLRVPTAHFDMYVQAGSPSDLHRREVGAAAERALAADLARLDAQQFPDRISLLFVTSRSQMRELTGFAFGGTALVEPEEGGDAAMFVARPSDGQGALRHELMHLITFKLWGQPVGSPAWLVEGIGTWGPGSCAGHAFDALAARLLLDEQLPTLDTLVHHFDNADNLAAYLASASLVQYVHDRYGTPGLRAIWQRGLGTVLATHGESPASLEASWRTHLRTRVSPAPRTARQEILARGCEG